MKRTIWDTNRTVARRPKKVGGWCDCCDAAKVYDGQKCPACGNRTKPSRNKRELTTVGNSV